MHRTPATISLTLPTGPLPARPDAPDRHGGPLDPHLFALADIAGARAEIRARGAAYIPCRYCHELQMLIDGDDGAVVTQR